MARTDGTPRAALSTAATGSLPAWHRIHRSLVGAPLAPRPCVPRAALVQGLFYVTSGLWPVVHLRSFEAVTGPKRDPWLARTTGALIAAVGLALLVGTRDKSRVTKTLGLATAVALGGADAIFVGTGQIPRVYLADAAAEAAAIGLWILD